MGINQRIRDVRRALDLTQVEFGKRIRLKGNSVALIEGGRNTSEQTIFSICKEFNVSEKWLRTGEGDMFVALSREEELSKAVEHLLSGEKPEFRRRLVVALAALSDEQWDYLEMFLKGLLSSEKVEETEEERHERYKREAREEAEEYYRELLDEKRREEEGSVFSTPEKSIGA